MNRCRLAAALALTFALVGGGAAIAAPRATPAVPGYDETATAQVLADVNAHRRALGLRVLTVDSQLADIAKSWATRMAANGTLSHNDALFTPATHDALGISYLGENVGDTWDPARFEPMFLASPHHRENIESPKFSVAGFAVVVDAQGQYWATEDFGGSARTAAAPRPAAAAPKPAARVARVAAPVRRAPHVASRSTRVAAVVQKRATTTRASRVDVAPAAAVTALRTSSRTGLVVAAALFVALVSLAARRAAHWRA